MNLRVAIFLLSFFNVILSYGQNQTMTINVECGDMTANNTRCFKFTTSEVKQLISLEFVIVYDPTVLSLVGNPLTDNSCLDLLNTGNFGILGNGTINFLWFTGPDDLQPGCELFRLCFKYIGEPGESSPIKIVGLNEGTVSPSLDKAADSDLGDVDLIVKDCNTKVLANGRAIVSKFCNPSSNSSNDGSITFYGIGGVPPYNFTIKDAMGVIIPGGSGTLADQEEKTINVPKGNYTIAITDGAGIGFPPKTINLIDINSAPTFDIQKVDPSCFYRADGKIRLKNINSISVNPKIEWSNGIFNVDSLDKLLAGTYTVSVIDDNKCKVTKSVTLNADTIKVMTKLIEPAACQGSTSGVIQITTTGGKPFTGNKYKLAFNNNFFNLQDNPYTWNQAPGGKVVIKVQDDAKSFIGVSYPCEVSTVVNIPYKDTVKYENVLIEPAPCKGQFGKVFFNVKGPDIAYRFPVQKNEVTKLDMNPPGVSNKDTYFNYDLRAGKYFVVVRSDGSIPGNKGCMDTFRFEIKEALTRFKAEANVVQPSCISFGSIKVTAMNGVPPYTYKWNDNSTANEKTNLGPGNYTITISDAFKCDTIIKIELKSSDNKLAKALVQQAIKCKGDKNGVVSVDITGGTYQWQDNKGNTFNQQSWPNLGPGTYYVTVTKDGCISKDSVKLFDPPGMLFTNVQKIQPECPKGGNKGSIGVTIDGGFPTYIYEWSKQGSSNIIGNQSVLPSIEAGTYKVVVRDQNGCKIDTTIVLTAPNPFNINITSTVDVKCFGELNGQARATASGGPLNNGKYTFFWSNGQKSSGLFNIDVNITLPAGQNWVFVGDTKCLSDTVFFNIGNKPEVKADVKITGVCSSDCKGQVELIPIGNGSTWSYNWPTLAQQGNIVYNVCPGSYPYIITDNSTGCKFTDTVTIIPSDTIKISLNNELTIPLSCKSSQGQIAIIVKGGLPGYTYKWSNNASNSTIIQNLSQGVYTVTVTDVNGCSELFTYTLSRPNPIEAEFLDIIPPSCAGGTTCVRVASVTGGTGNNYTMQINNSIRIPIDSCLQLNSGKYLFSIFDGDGCKTDYPIEIPNVEQLLVNLGEDIEIKLGEEIPPIEAQITSQLPIVKYLWTGLNGLTVDTFNKARIFGKPFGDALISLSVIDENGCIAKDQVIITVNEERNVFLPNIFMPSGQDGNKLFDIVTGFGVTEVEEFSIYDRWGNTVYKKLNYLPDGVSGWDGTLNGKELLPGVYVFSAKIKFIDGEVKYYKGDITLLR